ncbi:MAG: glucose-6-phosphate isomerase [Pseudomonadota bacterium]
MMEIDFGPLMAFEDRGGTLKDRLDTCRGEVASIVEKIGSGGDFLGWVGLPGGNEAVEAVEKYVASVPSSFTHAVILGIGGSSLGPRALYSAAYHPMPLLDGWKPGGLKLLFLDNSDPDTIGAVLDALDLKTTLFAVMSKSGSTAETASQLMVAWKMAQDLLGDEAGRHFVFVTDPARGDLRALSRQLGIAACPVPPDVGGRFSVLSSIGLLPAALAGIDPREILRGAQRVSRACLEQDLYKNPAALIGASACLLDRDFGRNVHVLWCYADKLADMGLWFRQLWGESLGKMKGEQRLGPTPLDARGATDQHSLLQLVKEGPADKFVMFVDVKERRGLPIPALFGEYGSFSYLGARGVEELIAFERRGTQLSLERAGVPAMTVMLDSVTAGSAAALMYIFEVATAVAGYLSGIEPFDQPGVEESKRFTQALMGRAGLEDTRKQIEEHARARDSKLLLRL